MSIPKRVTEFLKKHNIHYEAAAHLPTVTAQGTAQVEHVPGKKFAKAVMVRANQKDVMVVIPANRTVDLFKLSTALGTNDVRIEEEGEFKYLFPDCEVGAMPPFGKVYGVKCYIDKNLPGKGELYFNAGNHLETIKISAADFLKISGGITGDYSVAGKKVSVVKNEKGVNVQNPYQQVGETAGKIYRVLEMEGALMTVAALQKAIKVSDAALIHQALGWLARESKINLEKQGRTLVVSLVGVPALQQ